MKWEYKIVSIDAAKWTSTGLPHDIGERFDGWGNEGWELVRVEPIMRGSAFFHAASSTVALIVFFKRPKE